MAEDNRDDRGNRDSNYGDQYIRNDRGHRRHDLFGSSITAGDVLHLLEIMLLMISIGAGYQKLQAGLGMIDQHDQKLTRIEHYLSSKDPSYWRIVEHAAE